MRVSYGTTLPLYRSPCATVVALALAVFLTVVVLSGGVRTSLAVVFLMAVDVTLIAGRGGWSRRIRRPRRPAARVQRDSSDAVSGSDRVTAAPRMSISS